MTKYNAIKSLSQITQLKKGKISLLFGQLYFQWSGCYQQICHELMKDFGFTYGSSSANITSGAAATAGVTIENLQYFLIKFGETFGFNANDSIENETRPVTVKQVLTPITEEDDNDAEDTNTANAYISPPLPPTTTSAATSATSASTPTSTGKEIHTAAAAAAEGRCTSPKAVSTVITSDWSELVWSTNFNQVLKNRSIKREESAKKRLEELKEDEEIIKNRLRNMLQEGQEDSQEGQLFPSTSSSSSSSNNGNT